MDKKLFEKKCRDAARESGDESVLLPHVFPYSCDGEVCEKPIEVEIPKLYNFLEYNDLLPEDVCTTETHVRALLRSIGEDVSREGLRETPSRVAKMFGEIYGGYAFDPFQFLTTTFQDDVGIEPVDRNGNEIDYMQGMVIVRDIAFYSHCEHHMVPFFGKVHIGYIPGKKVVGLSKLCRVVDAYARRLQIQERLTKQIADCIQSLEPQGVMVVVEAEHLCMKMRGIKNPCADTVTSTVRGLFEQPTTRQEFLQLIRRT